MKWFKRINSKKINESIIKKEAFKKSLLFVIGALISALSFNLFFVPNNFLSGGMGGISIIINNLFNVDINLVILIGNIVFIIMSIIFLGFKDSIFSIIGAISYVIFVYATSDIAASLNFYFDNILLYVLAAGVGIGLGEGLVYKSGFTTGGTSIPAMILQKYTKKPLGKILRFISMIVIIIGGVTLGYTAVMYALLITFISSYMVDKILIGISDSKTFFIQTDKEDEVKDFILTIIKSGVTEFDTRGAYSHKKKKMLMCVVPTEKYSLLKSAIEEIDAHAFIVVSDCYEVYGGTKLKKALDI